jgi:O-methyltransferase domain
VRNPPEEVLGMTTTEAPPPQIVFELVNSHVVARCIHVVAEFGVADALAEEAMSADALAAATGMNADALARMLRLLGAYGVFAAVDGGYVNTPASLLLRSDHPASMRSYARMIGTMVWRAFDDLAHPAQHGTPAMDWPAHVAHFAEHPDEASLFNAAMADKAASVIPAVLDAYDFGQFHTIADIGGGGGHLLTAILDREPAATGILFELPHVIADAETVASPHLQLVAGDFFADDLPVADAYVLMEVLHDWSDEDATKILAAVRRAAPTGARVLVVEALIADDPGPDAGKVLDVIMLAATGGRERTREQYTELLALAGFQLERVVPTRSPYFVVEATTT